MGNPIDLSQTALMAVEPVMEFLSNTGCSWLLVICTGEAIEMLSESGSHAEERSLKSKQSRQFYSFYRQRYMKQQKVGTYLPFTSFTAGNSSLSQIPTRIGFQIEAFFHLLVYSHDYIVHVLAYQDSSSSQVLTRSIAKCL